VSLMASRGRQRRGLGEDDGATGLETAQADGVVGSRTVWGAQHHGFKEDNIVAGLGIASQAWGRRLRGRWRHRLGSGKMVARKYPRPWLGMTVRRL
jgi:hypothetical protein